MSNTLKDAYIKRAQHERHAQQYPYENNPFVLTGGSKKGKPNLILVRPLHSDDEPLVYVDGMDLLNDLIDRNKGNIEFRNLEKYIDVMLEEPGLENPRCFDLFRLESLPSVNGIKMTLTNDLLPTDSSYASDPNAIRENIIRDREGKTVTETYIKGLAKREFKPAFDHYDCTNDIQLAFATVMHCLRLGMKIKRCSECRRLYSMKSNSNRCRLCRAKNRLSANNRSKERIEYKYNKALYDTLMSRNAFDLSEELRIGYKQFGTSKDPKEAHEIRIQKLTFLWGFDKKHVHYKPRTPEKKQLLKTVEKILREEENNG